MSGAYYKDPKSALTEAASGNCVFSKQYAVQIEVIGKADAILENLSGFKNIMTLGLARWSSSWDSVFPKQGAWLAPWLGN